MSKIDSDKRQVRFCIENEKFLFDGNSLNIYELDDMDYLVPVGDVGIIDDSKLFLRSLALNVSHICDLGGCKYCYANEGGYHTPGVMMTWNTAKAAVDLLIKSAVKNNCKLITIGFFGGEPLTNFELIKRVVNYVNLILSDTISVRYLITTNGLMLGESEECRKFLKEHNFSITLSIDGDKKMHNAARVYRTGYGSYNEVIECLPALLDDFSINARLTISDFSYQVNKAIQHIVFSLGIERVTYSVDYDISDSNFKRFLKSLNRMFEYYYESIVKGKFYDITNISQIILSLVLQKRRRTHCNAGLAYLTVAADGTFYRCPRFTDVPEHSVGKVKEVTDELIQNSINDFNNKLGHSAIKRNSDCFACPYTFLCGGPCVHQSFTKGINIHDVVERECRHRKFVFERTLHLLCNLSVGQKRNFLLYLKQLWQKHPNIEGR